MYSKIINPKTGKQVSIKSILGKQILTKYLLILKGGAATESDYEIPEVPVDIKERIAQELAELSHYKGTSEGSSKHITKDIMVKGLLMAMKDKEFPQKPLEQTVTVSRGTETPMGRIMSFATVPEFNEMESKQLIYGKYGWNLEKKEDGTPDKWVNERYSYSIPYGEEWLNQPDNEIDEWLARLGSIDENRLTELIELERSVDWDDPSDERFLQAKDIYGGIWQLDQYGTPIYLIEYEEGDYEEGEYEEGDYEEGDYEEDET